MKRWNLVDKRKAKKATLQAHKRVRECKRAYKAWQRTEEPDHGWWTVAWRAWTVERSTTRRELATARARAQELVQFSTWLNGRRDAYIDERQKQRLLKEFVPEAVTMLADLVADGP